MSEFVQLNQKPLLQSDFYTAKTKAQYCIFCKPYESMKVLETQNFKVLSDTFPVVLGHLMISSKVHFGCAGEIPSDLLQELCTIKESVRRRFKENSQEVIFYEHGRAGSCSTLIAEGHDCEHFHLHCIQTQVCIHEEVNRWFEFLQIKEYNELTNCFFKHGNYLFFENVQKKMFFYKVLDRTVPSHFLRSIICKKLGYESRSNWEDYSDENLHKNNSELIYRLFKNGI